MPCLSLSALSIIQGPLSHISFIDLGYWLENGSYCFAPISFVRLLMNQLAKGETLKAETQSTLLQVYFNQREEDEGLVERVQREEREKLSRVTFSCITFSVIFSL